MRRLDALGPFEWWFAPWEMVAGDHIEDSVRQAIAESDAVLQVLTPDSIRSPWVAHEAALAQGADVPVVTLLHGSAAVPAAMAERVVVRAPWLRDRDAVLGELALALRTHGGLPPPTIRRRFVVRIRKLQPWFALLALAVGAVAAGALRLAGPPPAACTVHAVSIGDDAATTLGPSCADPRSLVCLASALDAVAARRPSRIGLVANLREDARRPEALRAFADHLDALGAGDGVLWVPTDAARSLYSDRRTEAGRADVRVRLWPLSGARPLAHRVPTDPPSMVFALAGVAPATLASSALVPWGLGDWAVGRCTVDIGDLALLPEDEPVVVGRAPSGDRERNTRLTTAALGEVEVRPHELVRVLAEAASHGRLPWRVSPGLGAALAGGLALLVALGRPAWGTLSVLLVVGVEIGLALGSSWSVPLWPFLGLVLSQFVVVRWKW